MKKTLALLLTLAMTFSLFLTACGDSKAPASDANTGDAADDTVYSFNIDYPNPDNSLVAPLLKEWATNLNEASNGRLNITVYTNGQLGSIADCVTNCVGGMTDGFWSAQAIYQGSYSASEAVSLPMIGVNNADVGTYTLNAMLNETDYYTKEYSNVHVICLHSACTMPLGFKESTPVTAVSQLAGLNMRVTGGYLTNWVTALGANPVSVSSNDGYEYLEKNIINAYMFDYDKIQSGALLEQTGYLMDAHIYASQLMFCLNQDKWNELPADLQGLINESADWYIEQVDAGYQTQHDDQIADAESRGITVAELPEDMKAEMIAAAEPVWQQWIDDMTAKGYDGQGIFDATKGYIDQFNAQFPYYN